MPKPLKELLEEWDDDDTSDAGLCAEEMARRLRLLDEEIRAVEDMAQGHNEHHPAIFTERLRLILGGKAPN